MPVPVEQDGTLLPEHARHVVEDPPGTGRVDDVLGATPLGQLLDGFAQLARGRIERRRAGVLGEAPLQRVRIRHDNQPVESETRPADIA